jgi:hypothetical protein
VWPEWVRGTRLPTPTRPRAQLGTAILGLAVCIGLVGAWIGLSTSSLWIDELFTHWVVVGDGVPGTVFSRLATDVHPPLYYLSVFLFTRAAGTSDAALRAFSALCACGAIVVFILGTTRFFSLGARLFAAAIAVSSHFWFYQAQNARDYSLSLLLGAAILSLALRCLDGGGGRPGIGNRWVAMGLLMIAASLVHFYMMFLSVAVLGVLFVIVPGRRIIAAGLAILILLTGFLYTQEIIAHYSKYSLTENWVQNTVRWNAAQGVAALRQGVGRLSIIALVLCGLLAILRLRSFSGAPYRLAAPSLQSLFGGLKSHGPLALCLAVPLLLVLEGIVSSSIVAPNVTDRNLLVCLPFVWALFAMLYDAAFAHSDGWRILLAEVVAASLVLAAGGIVVGRGLPRNEPFRESATWIKAIPACKGADIPVISASLAAWADSRFTQRVFVNAYDHYLDGFAHPRVLTLEDVLAGRLPDDLKTELARRATGQGCPVLAWSAHSFPIDAAKAVSQALPPATPPMTMGLQPFSVFRLSSRWKRRAAETFVVYVDRPGAPIHAD